MSSRYFSVIDKNENIITVFCRLIDRNVVDYISFEDLGLLTNEQYEIAKTALSVLPIEIIFDGETIKDLRIK